MSEKLLPCPFCGSAFKMGREPNDNHPVAGQFYLYHDYGPLGSLARLCPISINQHFYTDAEALTAWNTRAAVQADAAPVVWMYERGSERKVYVERSQAALACGYAETALYAHPPVADRVSTSSPVDDRAAPETSVKLRDAVEVWEEANEACFMDSTECTIIANEQAAAAVIEADREAVRAEQAAEVERLKKLIEAASAHFLRLNADHPIMWEGAIDGAMEAVCLEVERQAAELAKIKALAETLAVALDKLHEAYCADDYGTSEGRAFGRTALIETRKALRKWEEARDA